MMKQSFIYLLQHQATGRYVGSVRILFVNKHTPVQEIPMQKDLHIKNIEAFHTISAYLLKYHACRFS